MWVAHAPTLLVAFVVETANRATNVIFKFVPMRLGVDEAGTGWPDGRARLLESRTGVTLAIVRKMRVLFWTGIGLLLLARARPEREGSGGRGGRSRGGRWRGRPLASFVLRSGRALTLEASASRAAPSTSLRDALPSPCAW